MKFAVAPRTARGKALKGLRKADQLPGIVYANHMDKPILIQCKRQEFVKFYKDGGRSTVLSLSGDGINEDVLVQDVQIDPVTHEAIHVDFIGIQKGQSISTEVSVIMIGKAPVVTSADIKVQLLRDTIEISAKPKDLPHDIKVDISGIENTDDVIQVKDLDIPAGVTVDTDEDIAVVRVIIARGEVEEEPEVLEGELNEDGTPINSDETNEENNVDEE
jgi:large subunit ribosomal protein L25